MTIGHLNTWPDFMTVSTNQKISKFAFVYLTKLRHFYQLLPVIQTDRFCGIVSAITPQKPPGSVRNADGAGWPSTKHRYFTCSCNSCHWPMLRSYHNVYSRWQTYSDCRQYLMNVFVPTGNNDCLDGHKKDTFPVQHVVCPELYLLPITQMT
jgi:hypothetical protein